MTSSSRHFRFVTADRDAHFRSADDVTVDKLGPVSNHHAAAGGGGDTLRSALKTPSPAVAPCSGRYLNYTGTTTGATVSSSTSSHRSTLDHRAASLRPSPLAETDI